MWGWWEALPPVMPACNTAGCFQTVSDGSRALFGISIKWLCSI